MTAKIIEFPSNINISELIKTKYTNLMCHKIFLEEKIEKLELQSKFTDRLKHTFVKGKPVTGEYRFKILSFLNDPSNENWIEIKDAVIFGKYTSTEIWLKYKNERKSDVYLDLDDETLIDALEYMFDSELDGCKARLKDSSMKIQLLDSSYPGIDKEIDLYNI